uniref:Uncharacterized protein n=1 Tax=Cannabis sativa TaxID=3483 RepID=A0A803RB72_CANSA
MCSNITTTENVDYRISSIKNGARRILTRKQNRLRSNKLLPLRTSRYEHPSGKARKSIHGDDRRLTRR